MKKLIIKIIGLMIVLIVISHNPVAIAVSQKDVNNIDNQIEQKKDELDGIHKEKTGALKEIESLTSQISEYQKQIDELDGKLSSLNSQIQVKENEINQAKEDYAKQKELLEKRLVAMQESGDTTFLDVLLNSKGIIDFISNYYLISEMANSDTKLLEEIQVKKTEIENAKTELESSKNEVATAKASKQSVATQLNSVKSEKDSKVAKLTDDEKQTQAEIDQFEKDKREIQAELAEIARKEREEAERRKHQNGGNNGGNNGNTSFTPSAGGFIFPVSGLSRANISNKNFPSYRGHTGVDVNINVTGKTIVAVKDGVVQRSKAYISNGKYYSYGECIVINHGNGLATLYAHGSPNSRRVQVGETVKQGQPIMTVGTTGNSSGDHLHFEVLVNGSVVNPMSYLP